MDCLLEIYCFATIPALLCPRPLLGDWIGCRTGNGGKLSNSWTGSAWLLLSFSPYPVQHPNQSPSSRSFRTFSQFLRPIGPIFFPSSACCFPSGRLCESPLLDPPFRATKKTEGGNSEQTSVQDWRLSLPFQEVFSRSKLQNKEAAM